MKVPLISYLLTFFLLFFYFGIRAYGGDEKKVYVVYMGAANGGREDHVQLLASVLKREAKDAVKTLIHSYKHGFSGFAARLSKKEAGAIARKSGVVSVFVDPVLQLHTTRSWDFLQYQTDLEANSNTSSTPTSPDSSASGTDTIIGLLDTGVWPESESFNDEGMGAIPSRWKGICMEGSNFTASNCNKKLIGARYYSFSSSESEEEPNDQTPRDSHGHGTHTTSTAGGSAVGDASYYGLAKGTAKGGSPTSRIAMYKVCTSEGCRGSRILAGYDDAMGDGVDVISVSLGASYFSRPGFSTDPIAIGAFHAVEKGITVVCSAGNDGPEAGTVVNAAPWIFTVGATTIDRDFESDVVLGGNKLLKGEDINFSNLGKSPVYPLIYGGSAKSKSSTDGDASNCDMDALDGKKFKGKIVVFQHPRDSIYSKRLKIKEVKGKGGIGLILIEELGKTVASPFSGFPVTTISSDEGGEILSYIKSTRNPVATILPTVSVINYKPAPTVPYFSSRGPSTHTRNILKPDIAAPGVNILAAWKSTYDASEIPPGQNPSPFNLLSGSSMSCPHVSGVAATIKARNPTWSPSSIRSAIMTTASQTNNDKAPLTVDTGSTATPYDYGAGEVSPTGALEPGLVYETEKLDYFLFLCNYGYNTATIKQISNIPDGFACPKDSREDLISNLNYPSIAISKFDGRESKKVSRTVTNVGADDETVYTATIKSPHGLDVKVIPDRLQFTKNRKKSSYQVVFSSSSTVKGDLFGSITWTDEKHRVRTPFAVTSDVS